MDPSYEELAAIAAAPAPLEAIFDWVGISPEAILALREAVGDFRRVRDIVGMPMAAYEMGIGAARCLVPAARAAG
eukprot:14698427-Heterocapsa_arctica.AAC.1